MSFTPVVRTSVSITKSLLGFAKERKIDVKTLDFELIDFETLMKKEDDLEYETVEETQTITKEDFLNPTTIILQEYSIKIHSLKKASHNIRLTLATNKLKTKAVVTLLKGSVFHTTVSLHELRSIIWARKLRAGLFIDIFEAKLQAQLEKVLQVIPKDKALPKDVKFSVALGIAPTPPVDAHLEKLYEQKHHNGDSIVDCIDKDELILRYFKEQDGQNGRACNGKFLLMREPRVKNMQPVIDETIRIEETKEFINYYANEDGYVEQNSANFTISKTLKLEAADFKSTANIDGGDSSKEISVEISHKKSHNEDAIGSGVNIDVKELKSSGSVGSNVNITAQELNIDAQTHKNSKIEVANSANVKLHRGDMVAKDAEIDVLESGKITAHKSIHIKKMLGGEAIAPIVRVDELLSNAKIVASELIEIQVFSGTHNTLIIDPNAVESYHKDLDALKLKQKSKANAYKEMKEELDSKLHEHTKQIDRIKTFQKRALSAQKAGKTPMKQDMIRVKEYKRNTLKLEEEKKVVLEFKKGLDDINMEVDKFHNQDLHAKILSHTEYDGQSKVIFINVKTKEEIPHIPEGKIETISLVLNEDKERVIKLD